MGIAGRGSREGHGGDAEDDAGSSKKTSLFRTKSMPKRGRAFHYPLQVVSPTKRDALDGEGVQGRTEGWEDDAPPVEYGVESPTIPPPVAFAAMGRGSTTSEGTGGRGSKRLTM